MHPFLAPLSDYEALLLLTTMTIGGSDEVAIFEHLPKEIRARLEDKAKVLLTIPSKKRVPFMANEIKQALATQGLRGIERIDPSWMLQALKGESPRVVAAVLLGLPGPLVHAILRKLPKGIRHGLPNKKDLMRLPADVISAVRVIFKSRFEPMPQPSIKGFAFRDIVQMDRKDIYRLMHDLGLIELGQAFAAVGKMALAELCRRLPKDKAEELVLAVRNAGNTDLPDIKTAQRFLSRVVVNFNNTDEFFQKAGLWRLAKAARLEDKEFCAGLRQRLPKEAGQLFVMYLEKAAEMEELETECLQKLQDAILLRVQDMAKRGLIAGQWADIEMLFHQPKTN